MRSHLSTLVLSTVAALATSWAAAADVTVVASQVNVKSEVVRYDDLRLISAVGAAVLYGRLRAAAERSCGVPPDNRQIAMEAKYRACVDDAISKAVVQVNAPVLTQFHATKRGAPAPSRTTNAPTVTAAAEAR